MSFHVNKGFNGVYKSLHHQVCDVIKLWNGPITLCETYLVKFRENSVCRKIASHGEIWRQYFLPEIGQLIKLIKISARARACDRVFKIGHRNSKHLIRSFE